MSNDMTRIPSVTLEEINKVRLPLTQSYTLPKAAYTSDEVFDQEREKVLRKSWIPIARIDQVAEKSSFLTLDLLGQPVMVVHGNDDEIRVMSSVCLHRSAPIAEGCGKRNVFTCPYHAWSYDTTGQLKRAPLMEGADNFDESMHRLPQIRSEIWRGFIFANLDLEAEPLAPQVTDLTEYFKNFRLEETEIVETLEFESRWNWKVLVENFMEAYHHIATHSKTFEPTNHARESLIPDNSGPWSILHMPLADKSVDPAKPPVEGLEDWQARDLFASVIFPYFLFAIQGQIVLWYQIIPGAADNLLLKIHIMLPTAFRDSEDFDEIVKSIAATVTVIHEEDIEANDLVWSGLTAPMTEQGRLSPFEKSIWQINQWWLDQMLADD